MCNVSAIICVDAELDESSVDDVDRCQESIVSQSRALLPASYQGQTEHRVDKLREYLGLLGPGTRLIAVEHGNNLAVFFDCLTSSAVVSLRGQWGIRRLRHIVELIFTFLSGATSEVHIEGLAWPLTDYKRSLEFLSSMAGKQTVTD